MNTRTQEDALATRITYDKLGHIVSSESNARPVGTTVTLRSLFSTLPVRHREFRRKIKREFARLLSVLQADALVSGNVRFICSNQVGKGSRSTIVQTQGNQNLRHSIATVLGTKTLAGLHEFEVEGTAGKGEESFGYKWSGYVSKVSPGCGRAASDRHFCYVNNRPIDLPKVVKVANEVYRTYNPSQYPIVVLKLEIPTNRFDVNVTPDKRKVFLHEEHTLVEALRNGLNGAYGGTRVSTTFMCRNPLISTPSRIEGLLSIEVRTKWSLMRKEILETLL